MITINDDNNGCRRILLLLLYDDFFFFSCFSLPPPSAPSPNRAVAALHRGCCCCRWQAAVRLCDSFSRIQMFMVTSLYICVYVCMCSYSHPMYTHTFWSPKYMYICDTRPYPVVHIIIIIISVAPARYGQHFYFHYCYYFLFFFYLFQYITCVQHVVVMLFCRLYARTSRFIWHCVSANFCNENLWSTTRSIRSDSRLTPAEPRRPEYAKCASWLL